MKWRIRKVQKTNIPMPKISFGKKNGSEPVAAAEKTPPQNAPATAATAAAPVAATQPTPPAQAVAVRESLSPPTVGGNFLDDTDQGGFDPKNIIMPSITPIQRIGELSKVFNPGEIILSTTDADSKLVILPAHEKAETKDQLKAREGVKLVVLKFLPPQWVERTGSSESGSVANSPQEVIDLGGSADYKEAEAKGIPWYQPRATAMCLVQQPEFTKKDPDAAEFFPLEYEGNRFALCLLRMKGTWHTKAAKTLFTAKSPLGHLAKTGLIGGTWKLDTDPNYEVKGNVVVAPLLERGPATTDAFRAWVKTLFS